VGFTRSTTTKKISAKMENGYLFKNYLNMKLIIFLI
jgi:hypothetical protein